MIFAALGGPSRVAQAETPLSAIDWGPEITHEILNLNPTPSVDLLPPRVVAENLDAQNINATGLVPSSLGGLPSVLWAASSDAQTAQLINDMPPLKEVSAQNLFFALLTSETTILENGNLGGQMFEARVNKLFDMGAMDAAYALLEQVGEKNHKLTRMALDLGLIRGVGVDECAQALRLSGFDMTLAEQVYCNVMLRDWDTAEALLISGEAIGAFEDIDLELLWQFIDPEYADTTTPPSLEIKRITPLRFRLLLSLGAPKSVDALPPKYLWPYLTGYMGWRMQVEAAERLVKLGAAEPAILLEAYTKAKAAASGGVWDRAAAIAALEEEPGLARLERAFDVFHATFDDDLLAKCLLEMNLFVRLPTSSSLVQELLIRTGETPTEAKALHDPLLGALYGHDASGRIDVQALGIAERHILNGLEQPLSENNAPPRPLGLVLLEALRHIAEVPYKGHAQLSGALTALRTAQLDHIARAIAGELILEQSL